MPGTAARLVNEWQSQFQGQLIMPTDNAFHESRRVWNGMIDRHPAMIVKCASPADVRAGIRLARQERLSLSVRGGGHSIAGTAVCDGGLMVDLSGMKDIRVDSERREIVAAPGVLWGEFDRAAEAHGLATTGGQVSHTGIAGLTLGGGLGYLMSKYGTVCDNLLSVELVTADGEMLTASEDQNADLFWAMRGAGANFGVVTSFRYRVHPLGQILGGLLLHPRERARELIAFYREFVQGTPDELETSIGFLNAPDGTPLIGVVVVYAGPAAEGESVIAPLRAFATPVADLVRPMAYTEVQSMLDDAVPAGDRYYWKSNFLDELSPALAHVATEGANAMKSPLSMILMFEIKGAIRRVSRDAMAFDHRDPRFEFSVIGHWKNPAEDAENIAWTREVWTAAQPHVSSAVYSNHMTADETPSRVMAAYGPEKHRKLSQLKRRFDPDNLFCSNHNIAPARSDQ